MVKEIKFGILREPLLSERAENIEINAEDNLISTKYQLSNKYNPKMKFSICIEEINESYFKVEIKGID